MALPRIHTRSLPLLQSCAQFPFKPPISPYSPTKRHSSTLNVASARAYCLDLLRKHDKPSHLLSVFQPSYSKDTYLSLRAFNTETSLIPDQVSNTTLGRLRINFWRDNLTKLFSPPPPAHHYTPPAEPTLLLLSHAVHANHAKLTKGFLTRVLAEREKYLGNVPFRNMQDLEAYAEGTYASLLYATLEGLGLRDTGLDHVASHVGKAEGIVAVIRGLAVLARVEEGGAVVLPLDLCAEVGLRQEDVLRRAQGRGSGDDGEDAVGRLKEVVFRIATLANDHLITARKMVAEEPTARGVAFSGFMRAVPTAIYLERLERVDFDPFDNRLQRPDWKLPWRAYRAYTTRRF
ncbi:Squalene/phytoene synthase [Tuber borchii]|uniref:Squalene/phytoene synthase n=1 Tax=Tuber borchii TaxID=42251 RepID=A0A2T7A156_TUBBO|nr:Squalene/phytoene synthase [Tuber borchii]